MKHVPVLLEEALAYLAVRPDGIYVDATAGLGGHTGAIAQRLRTGFVIACDRDAESLELCRRNVAPWADRVRFWHGRFSELPSALAAFAVERADGLLADLGASLYQLTDPERGFSFSVDGPLDMRMDRSRGPTAAEIVNTMAEKALAELIFRFGEERRARKIARAVVRARPLRTTLELARVIERVAPRTRRLHPATQTFMALRLAVNDELGELERLLELAPECVRPGGRIVVISFMSLEDRRVKHRFQALARQGRVRLLTKHVVRPSAEEVRTNPAARSARLRAVEMV
ncbi:MAG: 16S rRNA (cytosine(1402)-N(4))-methyltransferase RsmH [Bryobacterales bacterium]|nr:16S rRNA (cytosine(1402)-N(4))-methyltransferase RsmH [Bryobacteraceae bacterium]MDW8356033.1 16S rRNA (cytosine(1402)-N(4))-methyltransferase RsmH [Bryobacterales bacterium]